ncbi:hypothetical protein ACET3Z_030180 [Daucus carota]
MPVSINRYAHDEFQDIYKGFKLLDSYQYCSGDKMENMKKLVISIALILLVVSLESAISEAGRFGSCFNKCKELDMDCDYACKGSGYAVGAKPMMSSDMNRDERNYQNSSSRGKAMSTTRPPAAINCPRCDSPNTKFCYYNNYSLTQPRHFCKTCKRYWTKGGALRNVPVGGGCRKNKKTSRASSSRPSSGDFKDSSGASSYSDSGGFRFYNSLQFQLGEGLTNFPRFNNISTPPPVGNQLVSSFSDIPTVPLSSNVMSSFTLDPNPGNNLSQFMALNSFPLSSSSSSSSVLKQDHVDKYGGFKEGLLHDTVPSNSNLAYSIESLSSINQDLHWKLQQDRLNTMFNNGGDNSNYQRQNGLISSTANYLEHSQSQKPNPLLFQNLEISSKPSDESRMENTGNVSSANLGTDWCFGNSSYAPVVNQNPAISSGLNISDIKENQAWANFDQFTTLP